MREKAPIREKAIQESEARIEGAKKTASEFLSYVEHSFDGFPSEAQWKGEFHEFFYPEYVGVLQNELLNSDRNGMKARLLEDLHQKAKGMGGMEKAWLAILRF